MLTSDVWSDEARRMEILELIERLRADPATKDLPVIVLTTETDDLAQQKVLESGADDYIAKPFKAPLLIARVKAALRRRAESVPVPAATTVVVRR